MKELEADSPAVRSAIELVNDLTVQRFTVRLSKQPRDFRSRELQVIGGKRRHITERRRLRREAKKDSAGTK